MSCDEKMPCDENRRTAPTACSPSSQSVPSDHESTLIRDAIQANCQAIPRKGGARSCLAGDRAPRQISPALLALNPCATHGRNQTAGKPARYAALIPEPPIPSPEP